MKKHLSTILVVVVFLCGLSLFLYPTISNLYNEHLNRKMIGEYVEAFANFTPEQFQAEKEKARTYNELLYQPEKLEASGLTYETVLNVAKNGMMGYIEIPKISVSLVIYHSLGDAALENGIGHMEGTSLPIGGANTHAVLAGHTGLPSAKLLTNVDHLKVGDQFTIHTLNETLTYQIDDVSVVEPHEVSHLSVISGKDYVTLVTCTPYGINSHRLLVRGVRVGSGDGAAADTLYIQNDLTPIETTVLITFSLIGLVIVFVAVRRIIRFCKKRKELKQQTKGGEEICDTSKNDS